jgi:hypothetical protein
VRREPSLGKSDTEHSLQWSTASKMSQNETKSSPTAESTQTKPPMHLNGKAAVAAPKLSDDDHVELADMLPGGPALDPEEDIMQLARVGNIQGIEKLYDSGKFSATYCDEEGITPLHVFALSEILELLY